jgi:hypothetical protein
MTSLLVTCGTMSSTVSSMHDVSPLSMYAAVASHMTVPRSLMSSSGAGARGFVTLTHPSDHAPHRSCFLTSTFACAAPPSHQFILSIAVVRILSCCVCCCREKSAAVIR